MVIIIVLIPIDFKTICCKISLISEMKNYQNLKTSGLLLSVKKRWSRWYHFISENIEDYSIETWSYRTSLWHQFIMVIVSFISPYNVIFNQYKIFKKRNFYEVVQVTWGASSYWTLLLILLLYLLLLFEYWMEGQVMPQLNVSSLAPMKRRGHQVWCTLTPLHSILWVIPNQSHKKFW